MTIGPYTTTGTYQVKNTATFTTNDTSSTGSATATVDVTVKSAATDCTYTIGYWQTHSKYAGVRNPGWDKIGEDTAFFKSGKTYYGILALAPKGDAYYILGQQYVAAKLNILNGASTTPEVDAAITGAEQWFATHKPGETLTTTQKTQLTVWATTLATYNNGLANGGPAHCS